VLQVSVDLALKQVSSGLVVAVVVDSECVNSPVAVRVCLGGSNNDDCKY
jgi:hypothetical protein